MIIVRISAGLGNQLFQYAFGYNFSKLRNEELYLDLEFFKSKPQYRNIYKLDHYNTDYRVANPALIKKLRPPKFVRGFYKVYNKLINPDFEWKGFHYTNQKKSIYPNFDSLVNKKKIYLSGYWAGEYFFKNNSSDIKNIFTLKNEYISELDENLIDTLKSSESVSVHIRRGDYVTNNYFHNLGVNYYKKSIDFLNKRIKNPLIVVFSDDIGWVKQNLSLNNKNIIYIDGNKDYVDLHYMSLCKHNIIANSTYSWWGAYLNKNPGKIVIAPRIWFNDYNAQNNYENKSKLIPSNWIKIGD